MFIKKYIFFRNLRLIFIPILAFFVALIVTIATIDLNKFKEDITKILQISTNLPLEIKGRIYWKFSFYPKIELTNIYIKKDNDVFFKSDKLEIKLNPLYLVLNKPTINNVKFYDAVIFFKDKKIKNTTIKEKKISKKITKYPFANILFDSIDFKNLIIKTKKQKYVFNSIHLESSAYKNEIIYKGWLTKQTNSFLYSIIFYEYDEKNNAYPIKLAIFKDDKLIKSDMLLNDSDKLPKKFEIKGDIKHLDNLLDFINIKTPKIDDINVEIKGTYNNKNIKLNKFNIKVGNNDLSMSGFIDLNKKIDVVINSNNLNLLSIYPDLYKGEIPTDRELNVFKDVPLFGEEIKNWDISIKTKIKNLIVYRDLNILNLNTKLKLKKGIGGFEANTNFMNGITNILSSVNIDKKGMYYLKVIGHGDELIIGKLFKEIRLQNYIKQLPITFDVYAESTGKDLSEIMKNIYGKVVMSSMNEGTIEPHIAKYVYGGDFITNIRHNVKDLFTLNKKYNSISINCVGAKLYIKNGVVKTNNGIAIETNLVNIRLAGLVDLGNEKINISLITTPVRGLKLSLSGNLTNLIEFKDNLAEPTISINGSVFATKIVLGAGIGLALTPFTGGLSLLGTGIGFVTNELLDSWGSNPAPCSTALQNQYIYEKNDPLWLNQDFISLKKRLL